MNNISITLFESSTAKIGEIRTLPWPAFASELKHRVGPKDGTAFACGTFKDGHRTSNKVQSRKIVAIDVEQIVSRSTGEIGPQPPSVDALAEKIRATGYAAVIYTTHSHTPDAPRYRVVMRFDGYMSIPDDANRSQALGFAKELPAVVADHLGLTGCVDSSKFGAASIFFAPRCSEENLAHAQIEVIEGRPLELDQWLRVAIDAIFEKKAKKLKMAESVAKIAVAKRASVNNNGRSLIERLHPHLPTMSEALHSAGYTYYPNMDRWLSPHSSSGIAGVVVLKCDDGIDRAYIHHASDPLCGERDVFGVKAHDALDIIIANRFGTTDDDFRRGLSQLAHEYGVERLAEDNIDWSASTDADGWEEPLPFMTPTIPAKYPLAALPEGIRSAIKEVADFVKAPISMIASSALGAMSLAIQAEADVKRAEGLSGPSSLFILVIAESGERKSSCDSLFTKGIQRFEADATKKAMPLLKKYDADFQAWDVKVKGTKAQIHNFQKEGKSTEDAEATLKKLIEDEPKKPRVARLFYSDTTSEELGHNLSQTWPSGGIMSAEAGLVLGGHSMGKDSAMRTLALYNLLWDGKSVQIDRRMSTSFKIDKARLTIVLQVQEAPLREFVLKSGDLARGTGFFARFLLCRPETTQGFRPFTEPPFFMAALETFNDRLYAILDNCTAIDGEGNLSPRMLPLSPEAKSAWITFHDTIERQLVTGGQYQDVRDVASKIADNAARLAAIFHVYEGQSGAISGAAMSAAVAIVQWHLDESLRFFSELSIPEELSNAMRLERWMIKSVKHSKNGTWKRNDMRQKGPIRDKKALEAALQELVELKRVRCGSEGRTKVISINPHLLKD